MKPTKMRNQLIYRASHVTRSKQVSSPLSKELKKKFSKKSVRVVEGDSIKIVRGEFKGVDGKIAKISIQKSSLAIEGVKKEKTKGEKFDVYVHSSNVIVTGLNSEDKWRVSKLEGKKPSKKKELPSTKAEKASSLGYEKKETSNKETKVEKTKEKEDEKKETSNKETKVEKTKEKETSNKETKVEKTKEKEDDE
jgi:large subunit ribosomal protein L24